MLRDVGLTEVVSIMALVAPPVLGWSQELPWFSKAAAGLLVPQHSPADDCVSFMQPSQGEHP